MAQTTSWAFPNILDPTHNRVNIAADNASVTNRVKLLLLTEPTELYAEPTFGVGLKQYLWQYNTDNTKAHLQSKIIEQLNTWEPSVAAEDTSFADGLLFSEGAASPETVASSLNHLKMTVGLHTTFGTELNINTDDLQSLVDYANQVS